MILRLRVRLVDSSSGISRILTSPQELEEIVKRRVCMLALRKPDGYTKVFLYEVTGLENEEEVHLIFPVRGG